ncbi:MAG: anti-sigma-D factor RsdA [Pseudonocardiaceae bacterium]
MSHEQRPADLPAVQADDLLLDMLGRAGRAGRAPGDVDGELARVLAAWRREVHADSSRVLVDTDTAAAVIGAARRKPRRAAVAHVAAALAVLIIVFSLFGLVAKSAEPGDWLYPLREVLYGQPAADGGAHR